MMKKLSATLILLVLSATGQAAGIDGSLSNESAYFKYLFDSTNIVQGGADISLGFFFNDDEQDGVDIDARIGTAQFTVTGNLKGTKQRVKLSAGVKAYAGTLDGVSDTDIGALSVGGRAAYIIPSKNTPMAAYFEAYIAPGITSFGDTDAFREFTVGYEVEVAPSAKGYIGYRFMEVDFDGISDDIELDDNVHIGLQITF